MGRVAFWTFRLSRTSRIASVVTSVDRPRPRPTDRRGSHTDDPPIAVSQIWEGLSSCLAYLAAVAPGCLTDRHPGAITILGATDDAAGNRLFVFSPETAETAVRSFVTALRQRGSAGSIVAGGEACGVVDAFSGELGLDRAGPLPLLIARPETLTSPSPLGAPAAVEPVMDPHALAEMLALMARVLEVPRGRLARLYPTGLLELTDVRAFVARRGGRLVSYVTTISSEALTTVVNVGTRPDRRGRGEATGLLAAVLARLRGDGGELFALNATPDATGLYRRLGFEACDEGAVWNVDADAGPPTPWSLPGQRPLSRMLTPPSTQQVPPVD